MSWQHTDIWSYPGHYQLYLAHTVHHWKTLLLLIFHLALNQYVWILFGGSGTNFGWDIANFLFDHDNSRSWLKSDLMVPLEAYSSIDMIVLVSWQWDHLWSRKSKFHVWPGKFKVKIMAKVKLDGPVWGQGFNRYVCFLFHGNGTIFGWDITNFTVDHENWRSRPQWNLTKI